MRLAGAILLLLPALLLAPLVAAGPSAGGSATAREWRCYGGDPGATRFSPLDQVNRGNVARLKVAWTFHTGDSSTAPPTTNECNPIVVDGTLYLTSATVKAMAVYAVTGAKRWEFDPGQREQRVTRGVTYWQSGSDRRILLTAGASLYAL